MLNFEAFQSLTPLQAGEQLPVRQAQLCWFKLIKPLAQEGVTRSLLNAIQGAQIVTGYLISPAVFVELQHRPGLLEEAERALYRAKSAGGDCVKQ